MIPTLYDKDLIAIDKTKTEMTPGVFVARRNNELFVKRINFLPQMALLIGDNIDYPPISAEYNENFELIGRGAWYSRKMK
jgi:phage repressor protein C with HTH and peptisase S24 domain